MRSILPLLFWLLLLFSCSEVNTEVFLFDIIEEEEKQYAFKNPRNISDNTGYDNQPSFWNDSKSILYARTEKGQTEIARYFIDTKETKIISSTPNGSEYSPLQIPETLKISSIRLDETGLQRLYSYKLNGENEPLVPDLKIGYHAWIRDNELISFVLGEPATMQWINLLIPSNTVVTENIGRSLHQIPNTNLISYVDQSTDQWVIKSMDLEKGENLKLVETLPDSEDYCWTPNGEILMTTGTQLSIWKPEYDSFRELTDFSDFGIKNITRMSVSPDGKLLAIVAED